MFNSLYRLEPYNKMHAVNDGIQAGVKDPLWLLGRQWQLEEFTASNGGAPVRIESAYTTQRLDKLKAANNAIDIVLEKPLESFIEDESSAASPCWNSKHLEYNFNLTSADGLMALAGYEYGGEQVDWYTFNLEHNQWPTAIPMTSSSQPNTLKYHGMPSARWWTFENGQVNLNALNRPYCNLLTMMLVEFSLIYSQDWYLLPLSLTVGHIRKIETIQIIDSFNIISRANPITDNNRQNNGFEVFTLAPADATVEADTTLFYFPNNLYRALESQPFEEVNFVRDEMSNMVWAIEQRYTDSFNNVIERHEAANRQADVPLKPSHYWEDNQLKTAPTNSDAQTVVPLFLEEKLPPRHWIPYVQQYLQNQAVLLRARTYNTDETQYLGKILEESRMLAEEEIPNIGIKVLRNKQLARATNGAVVVWSGRKKQPDPTRTNNNLQFDCLIEQ